MLATAKSVYREAKRKIDQTKVLVKFQHQHGNRNFRGRDDEFFVVSLVKNAEYFIEEFIGHYSRLGAKQIILIDNVSTDSTVERAKRHKNVSIFTCDLPFREYERKMRGYFIEKHLKGQWVLCADSDEHFDFPHSGSHSMADFLGYLNRRGFTAVTACMLDMYAKEGFSKLPQGSFASVYSHFDLGAIKKLDYPRNWFPVEGNDVPPGIGIFAGGVRSRVMNTQRDCLLTKHPLLRVDGKIMPFTHPHYCAHAKIADVQCVLLHYKFTEGFESRAHEVLAKLPEDAVWARENKAYVDYINRGGGSFYSEHSVQYLSVEALAAHGLLQVPADLFDRPSVSMQPTPAPGVAQLLEEDETPAFI